MISTLFSYSGSCFRLQETFKSLATDGACKQVHLSHVFFFLVQLFTVCVHNFAQCTHATCVAQGSSLRLCFVQKSRSISRAMSNTMMHGTRSTSSSTFSSVLGPVPPRRLITSTTPCADSQQPQVGGGCPELPRHTLHGKAALVLQCTFTHVFFLRFCCWCEVHSLFGKIGNNILNTKLFQHGLARSCQIQNV